MSKASREWQNVAEERAQAAVYCVVVLRTGEITYQGDSLAAAAAHFEPGCICGAAATGKQAERLAQRIAEAIRQARQGNT